jgi:tetratricopeptide (TPR) repeat protein
MPSSLVREAGPELRYLRAYVLQRTGDHASAVGELEALARTEPAFTQERHDIYYYLARSHDALQHFDKAVRAARAYVEAAARAERTSRDPLPEPTGAPTTDAPGAAEKGWKPPLNVLDSNLPRLAKKSLTP